MSKATHFVTAPEDRIPFYQKLVYGTGAFVNNTLAAAMGGMVIFVPFAASGIAIWAIATYTVTEEKAYEVRQQLEARRGT